MEWIKTIVAIALGLYLIDLMGLWLESRGWVYWRKKKPLNGGGGNALQEFESFLRPSIKHVIEVKQRDPVDQAHQGEGASDPVKWIE